jgi:hypothetical protein
MSVFAKDLLALNALPLPHGCLTDHLLRELALNIIAPGVKSEMEGL